MPRVPKVWAWERHPTFRVSTPRREQVRAGQRSELAATLAHLGTLPPARLAVEFPDCTSVYALPGLLGCRRPRKHCAEGQVFPEGRVRPQEESRRHFITIPVSPAALRLSGLAQWQLFFLIILLVDPVCSPSAGPGRGPSGSCISWGGAGVSPGP